MCGIAGVVSTAGPVPAAVVARMGALIDHRGPDQAGAYARQDGPFAVEFATRRLAIRDLSPAGRQPMASEDGRVVLAYNGELYNDSSLRRDLSRAGHAFRSGADTETVLRAYLEWGDAALARLEGMFAFAVHDARTGRVLLARDRLGIKPLYYHWDGGRLSFASELRALLACPWLRPEIDPEALSYYLSMCSVAAPMTMLRGVRKVEPGTRVVFERGSVREARYWTPAPLGSWGGEVPPDGYEALVGQTREVVTGAIERQLVSDVPLGVMLSGGIDSTIITGVARRSLGAPVDTYAVGYELPAGEPSWHNDDLEYARIVSQAHGTCHHEVVLDAAGLAGTLRRAISSLDEPLCEATSVSQLALAELARREGTIVLLTGDGADELYGGYGWYRHLRRIDLLRRIPFSQPLARWLAPPAAHQASAPAAGLRARARAVLRLVAQPEWALFQTLKEDFGLFTAGDQLDVLTPRYRGGVDAQPVRRVVTGALARAAGGGLADRVAWLDLCLWVAEFFNQRLDRMTMLASVEARVPFQDERVVRHALALPVARKLRGGQTKALLRDAFAAVLPPAVLARPKRPFAGPYDAWLRGPLRPMVIEALAPGRVARFGVLEPASVRRLVERFYGAAAGERVHPAKLWALLVFQVWCETLLTTGPAAPPHSVPAPAPAVPPVPAAPPAGREAIP